MTATQAGDAQTNAASSTQSVQVAGRPQSVTLGVLPALVYGQTTLVAASCLDRSVTLSTTGACTVVDGELTGSGVGSCTVTATQEGDAETDSASASQSVQIAKRPQVVTLDALPGLVYLQTTTLGPVSSLDLTVGLAASGPCTLADGVLTASGIGLCTVTTTLEVVAATRAAELAEQVAAADAAAQVARVEVADLARDLEAVRGSLAAAEVATEAATLSWRSGELLAKNATRVPTTSSWNPRLQATLSEATTRHCALSRMPPGSFARNLATRPCWG